jgi:hypothetical protein
LKAHVVSLEAEARITTSASKNGAGGILNGANGTRRAANISQCRGEVVKLTTVVVRSPSGYAAQSLQSPARAAAACVRDSSLYKLHEALPKSIGTETARLRMPRTRDYRQIVE